MTTGAWIMIASLIVLAAIGIAAAMFGAPQDPED